MQVFHQAINLLFLKCSANNKSRYITIPRSINFFKGEIFAMTTCDIACLHAILFLYIIGLEFRARSN